MPRVRHIFLIVLENQSLERWFDARSPAPYMAQQLAAQGAVLTNYYAIGHNSLGNYVALVSGQAPNEATQGDCIVFSEFRLAQRQLDAHGQALGTRAG